MRQGLKKRSVVIAGHKTSVSLEDAFWQALKRLAAERGTSVNRLVAGIDRRRSGSLSGAIRVTVLEWLQRRADSANNQEKDTIDEPQRHRDTEGFH